jgi:hypothetical protein
MTPPIVGEPKPPLHSLRVVVVVVVVSCHEIYPTHYSTTPDKTMVDSSQFSLDVKCVILHNLKH